MGKLSFVVCLMFLLIGCAAKSKDNEVKTKDGFYETTLKKKYDLNISKTAQNGEVILNYVVDKNNFAAGMVTMIFNKGGVGSGNRNMETKLVFSGKKDNAIVLTKFYRKVEGYAKDDNAGFESTQLFYELNDGNVIKFENFEILVENVNSSEITYQIVKD